MKNETHLPSYHIELHYKRPLYHEDYVITNSKDIDTCLRDNINLKRIDHKEFFWIVLLTRANQVLGISEISSGKTDATTINHKEIVQLVALSNATSIILVHNHPSGKLTPSISDKKVTKRIGKTLELIDVILLDHLIISSEGYYSMADNDLITHPNS